MTTTTPDAAEDVRAILTEHVMGELTTISEQPLADLSGVLCQLEACAFAAYHVREDGTAALASPENHVPVITAARDVLNRNRFLVLDTEKFNPGNVVFIARCRDWQDRAERVLAMIPGGLS